MTSALLLLLLLLLLLSIPFFTILPRGIFPFASASLAPAILSLRAFACASASLAAALAAAASASASAWRGPLPHQTPFSFHRRAATLAQHAQALPLLLLALHGRGRRGRRCLARAASALGHAVSPRPFLCDFKNSSPCGLSPSSPTETKTKGPPQSSLVCKYHV